MTQPTPVLEPAAQEFADATSKPPFLYDLGPVECRKAVDDVPNGEGVERPEVEVTDLTIPRGPSAQVSIRIYKPAGATGRLPALLYTHGAGWVFGNAHTHDRLVRELCVGSSSAVVFANYALSPEAKYPTAIEEIYTALSWIASNGSEQGIDGTRIAVAGDSVGGNMTIAMTLMAKQRGGPKLAAQLLYYPVTDAGFDTGTYDQFATGYFLSREGIHWFWDQYTTDPAERAQITASPLRASLEDLAGLPPALVITGEADVLRDEGEAYAAKLRAAGVPTTAVRFGGIIHDFVMVDAMRDTYAARAATRLGGDFLTDALRPTRP